MKRHQLFGLLLAWISVASGFITSQRPTKIPAATTPRTRSLRNEYTLKAIASWEDWYIENLNDTYEKALRIRCPFFRRRAADTLDSFHSIIRFLIIRHKSITPPGWRCKGETLPKQTGLPIQQLAEIIQNDWCPETNKGYYITGRVSTSIYRDDCFFHGPDPDMPVRGLRKYLDAASQLFDAKESHAELLSISVAESSVLVHWRLRGVLRLPWKPRVPEWTGSTTYHIDSDGLVYEHVEMWNISVAEAFLRTLWPALAHTLWKDVPNTSKSDIP